MDRDAQKKQVQDALRVYLGLTVEAPQEEVTTQDWHEHDATVAPVKELTYAEHVNAIEKDVVDLDKLTLIEKVDLLMHDTLNQLLAGNIMIENAEELISTIQAVDMALSVKKATDA